MALSPFISTVEEHHLPLQVGVFPILISKENFVMKAARRQPGTIAKARLYSDFCKPSVTITTINQVHYSFPSNGRVQPLGGFGASTFACQLTLMRVETPKSREISQVGCNPLLARPFTFAQRTRFQGAFPSTFSRPVDKSASRFN